MTEKNHVIMTEVVSGICPECQVKTLLVGFDTVFYRCTTCGSDLEQRKNGVINLYGKVEHETRAKFKKTSQSKRRPKKSSMNKHKKRSFKAYAKQGR